MVEFEMRAPVPDKAGHEIEWRTLTRVRIEGEHVDVEGDERIVDFSVPVTSLRTGEQLIFEDNKEEWARNLPDAYRSGDLVVVILGDDDPLTPADIPEPEVIRSPIELGRYAAIPA